MCSLTAFLQLPLYSHDSYLTWWQPRSSTEVLDHIFLVLIIHFHLNELPSQDDLLLHKPKTFLCILKWHCRPNLGYNPSLTFFLHLCQLCLLYVWFITHAIYPATTLGYFKSLSFSPRFQSQPPTDTIITVHTARRQSSVLPLGSSFQKQL